MSDRILRIEQVLEMTGLSRSSLYRRIKDGTFPEPLRLGGDASRAVGWLESEVLAWIASRPRAAEAPHRRRQNTLPFQPRSDGVSIRIKLGDTSREPVEKSA